MNNEPIKFKDLKRIIKDMEGAEGVTDDTLVLVPTTQLLDRMRPLVTLGYNIYAYKDKDGYYSIASTEETYPTKQKVILLF